jgi:cell division GTPase FtsZ
MMENSGASNSNDGALTDMVNGLREESINRGATALLDEDLSSFGVPNPRILIVGCGGSGNNTLNRITHLGVEGAVTVAINTDKQHLDHTRALQKLLVGRHITRGLGAGGDPSTGRRCAEAGREMIKRIVTGANLPLDEAFSIMDQLVAEIVKGIVETITLPSLINLDFADVRAIMANGGVTMMLYGESDRGPEEVVHEALNHPLLDVDISGATGVLIHVTGGQYMTLEAASQVVDLLTAKVSEDANVIWGARQDAGFGDTIKVMAIITGVGGTDLRTGRLTPDILGDALRITRGNKEESGRMGFQRFD